MRVILTRPTKDATPLAAKVKALGHEPLIVPLLEIVPRDGVTIPAEPYQGVCITSANGLANVALLAGVMHLPVYCVGPQSAAAARTAGFKQVQAHGGDVDGLAAFIVQHLAKDKGPLLYLSGAATSGELEGKLRAAGFHVTRVVAYDAVSTTPADLREAVSTSDAVLLYSPRSAALWRAAIEKAGCAQHMARMTHLCLSANVARALPPGWPHEIAANPDEEAMLAALETLEPLPEQE